MRTLGAIGVLLLAALLTACASTAPTRQDLSWPSLTTFRSEAEFSRYLHAARKTSRERGYWWSGGAIHYAQAEDPCPPELAPCPEDDQQEIVTTGMRASAPSITNNQSAGVDEGDIVKHYGQFLIVLQDGRLFSVDTRPNGAPGLALVDRANVYRSDDADTWYDEVLIFDNRIIVTGYSYDAEATEFSIFTINSRGRLQREATYYLSSNDYYDGDNYATRVVDDQLIIYTPIFLNEVDIEEPLRWPRIRRHVRDSEDGPVLSRGATMFSAADLYRPLQPALNPAIHSVSVCALGSLRAGDELECRTTAVVAAADLRFYVSPTAAYLWTTRDEDEVVVDEVKCRRARLRSARSGVLYRVDLRRGTPEALFTRGAPRDQLAMDSTDTEFRALVNTGSDTCDPGATEVRLHYFSTPRQAFRRTPSPFNAAQYVALPSVPTSRYDNRFTDAYVVYGGQTGYDWAPDIDEVLPPARVVAVPLAAPAQPTSLETPHQIIRAERVGENIVVTGYRDGAGLSVSVIDLTETPRIAGTIVLEGRYESEGRSHAFNSVVGDDATLFGLPTIEVAQEADRVVWRSEESDVSFLTLDPSGAPRPLGFLRASETIEHEDYDCDVSCVDWYGNSRPIFLDGRIFALSNVEIVEGAIVNGAIAEQRRVNLTAPPAPR